jgi:hypothetical protein
MGIIEWENIFKYTKQDCKDFAEWVVLEMWVFDYDKEIWHHKPCHWADRNMNQLFALWEQCNITLKIRFNKKLNKTR